MLLDYVNVCELYILFYRDVFYVVIVDLQVRQGFFKIAK